jgi:2-oxo-4-hydroxy-4-carboxy-5-ureidoimidazoline decarboxylase
MRIEAFDALSRVEAESALRSCCGATRWVQAVAAGRPYHTVDRLLEGADAVWEHTGPADWEEAFAHHPRIGETSARVGVSAAAQAWSSREQARVAEAEPALRDALAEGNREYERRFGRIYIVCAADRSLEALLADLRARLLNPPDVELRVAAEAQRQITQLRLRRLFAGPREASP